MRDLLNGSITAAVLCAATLTGCSKGEPAMAKPTTMASATTKPAVTVSTTLPAAAAAPAVAMTEKDMTHEVTAETPVFSSMPIAADATPAVMLKAGDKVLVMVPRGKHAQITTVDGTKGYVTTASLKPIGG
jgi:hypothetical protein